MMLMEIKLKALHGTFGKLSSLTQLHQNGTGNMRCIQQAKGGQNGKFQSVVNVYKYQSPAKCLISIELRNANKRMKSFWEMLFSCLILLSIVFFGKDTVLYKSHACLENME